MLEQVDWRVADHDSFTPEATVPHHCLPWCWVVGLRLNRLDVQRRPWRITWHVHPPRTFENNPYADVVAYTWVRWLITVSITTIKLEAVNFVDFVVAFVVFIAFVFIVHVASVYSNVYTLPWHVLKRCWVIHDELVKSERYTRTSSWLGIDPVGWCMCRCLLEGTRMAWSRSFSHLVWVLIKLVDVM